MKKRLTNCGDRVRGYRCFENLPSLEVEVVEFKRADIHESTLFDSIFAIDERTKLPQGDIAVYMSENTSSEVRQFIQQNLLHENNVVLPENGKGLDDDVIASLTRGKSESVSQYRDRVMSWLKQSIRETSDVDRK